MPVSAVPSSLNFSCFGFGVSSITLSKIFKLSVYFSSSLVNLYCGREGRRAEEDEYVRKRFSTYYDVHVRAFVFLFRLVRVYFGVLTIGRIASGEN